MISFKHIFYLFLLIFIISSCADINSNKTDPKPCILEGQEIKDQESLIFYLKDSVNYNEECKYIVRSCNNGVLSGDDTYTLLKCEKSKAKPCILDDITLEHNESKIFYSESTVNYGKSCDYIIRSCNNGVLSGDETYNNLTCTVNNPLPCEIDGITVEDGEGVYLYSKDIINYGEDCKEYRDFRVCKNGVLLGNPLYEYQSCTNSNIVSREAKFIMKLKPQDTHTATDNSGNVIQGITSFGKEWFVSQDAGNGYVLFNHLSSQGNHIEDWQISFDSHGQDLSWNFENDKMTLYTVSGADDGIVKYQVTWNPRAITVKKTIKLFNDRTNVTPTLNTYKTRLAARATLNDDYYNAKIFLYMLSDLNSGNTTPYSSFSLDSEQIGHGQYFQGIVFYKTIYVYCLTGNDQIDGDKRLYKYSAATGEVLAKYTITAGQSEARADDNDGNIKYEPEGLTYKDGYLYFTIMSGELGARVKRLYRVELF